MLSKRVTNKDLLRELDTLRLEVELLQEQVQSQQPPDTFENRVKFLLAEFSHISEFWRHTDSRMESSLNLYFAASAIIATGLAYLSQQFTDLRSFFMLMTLAAVVLFAGGMMVARRILGTSILKSHYISALNLIRRHFVDLDESLSAYLALPTAADPREESDAAGPYYRPRIPIPLLLVIYPVS